MNDTGIDGVAAGGGLPGPVGGNSHRSTYADGSGSLGKRRLDQSGIHADQNGAAGAPVGLDLRDKSEQLRLRGKSRQRVADKLGDIRVPGQRYDGSFQRGQVNAFRRVEVDLGVRLGDID